MGKKIKRALAALLAAAMTFSLAPAALAENDWWDDDFDYSRPRTESSAPVTGKKVTKSPSASSGSSKSTGTASSSNITGATPIYDVAVKTGQKATFSCYAPGDSKVTASWGGKSYSMKPQKDAPSSSRVRYTATITVPSVSGTKNLGQVTYKATTNGKTAQKKSEANMFAVGKNSKLVVQMKDMTSVVFKTASTSSNFVGTVEKNAVDYVSEIGSSMYKLGGMNGWISQSLVQPLETQSYKSTISSASFSKGSDYERYTFKASGRPTFTHYETSSKFYLRFSNTSGLSRLTTSGSKLFSGASVSREGGDTVISFSRTKAALWGFLVEYKNGAIVLTCRYKPTLRSGSKPLTGITIAVDAGHGGNVGAPRPAGGQYNEDYINLKNALNLRKKLENLGAKVIMTRTTNKDVSLDDRMKMAQNSMVDMFVAMHCNASGGSTTANGVEVYYYEELSKNFATKVLNGLLEKSGRANRGIHTRNFKVTLNTFAPSLLVEVGYMTNPSEYEDISSDEGVMKSVNGVVQGILDVLK